MRGSREAPRAAPKSRTKADIVFCIDATASMKPCLDAVLGGLNVFVDGLQSAATVDYRLRLIAYRDRHDLTCTVPFEVFDFASSVDEFKSWLSRIKAECNQQYRGAESALDAIYIAAHSPWRTDKTHKTIVLMTDDCSHPSLHPTTYPYPDNTVARVIQDLQELRNSMLFMIAPQCAIYEALERSMKSADRRIVADWVPSGDARYEGLRGVDWPRLMLMLGQTVSAATLTV